MINETLGHLTGQQPKTQAEHHFYVPRTTTLHILPIEESSKPKKYPSLM